ncbi:MAG: YegP family protein [Chitinophagales bacterium]|jgi:hypothetical protein|nr:YegP family protein [Chitinophagales bacterium]
MYKFIISNLSNGYFQFSLITKDGSIILKSESYVTKAACENGIASVKKNAINSNNYILKISSNGKFYFYLKASNGQIIGTSEMYLSQTKRDEAIQLAEKHASEATIEENIDIFVL